MTQPNSTTVVCDRCGYWQVVADASDLGDEWTALTPLCPFSLDVTIDEVILEDLCPECSSSFHEWHDNP